MNVRPARRADAELVAELLDEATRWVGERGFEQWPLPFPRDQLVASIDRGEVHVVEEDCEPVATVTLYFDDARYWGDRPPDAVYVHKLAVRRDRAGLGLGAAIINWAAATALAAQRQFVRLDCLADNPGIRRYYEELGFDHRGDLELGGRNMSLYERRVHRHGN